MAKELETAYFRKLQTLYCNELQMTGFLADLTDQTADFKFGSSMHGVLRLCHERGEALEKIAADHEFSPDGDDDEAMDRLLTEGRHELRHCSRGRSRDVVIADICISLHRFLMVNYRLARNLAERLGLTEDASRLEELMELVEERFPQTCERPVVRRIAFAPPALAV
jgi:ferritin-like metal-binding protein YciE